MNVLRLYRLSYFAGKANGKDISVIGNSNTDNEILYLFFESLILTRKIEQESNARSYSRR
ncbi:MAG: hypothetical protein HRU23_14595 [Gammaproteobacteria bacterium]|nr:hypothetical protein [Gammaproteobacteria bacterium]